MKAFSFLAILYMSISAPYAGGSSPCQDSTYLELKSRNFLNSKENQIYAELLEKCLNSQLQDSPAAGERSGLFLSFASGFTENLTIPYVAMDREWDQGSLRSNVGACLALRLGLNSGNRFELAFKNTTDLLCPYAQLIALNSITLQAGYYFRAETPSLFIECAGGRLWWRYPLDGKWDEEYSSKGPAWSIGVGYEFRKHSAVVMEYQFSRVTHESTILEGAQIGGRVAYATEALFRQRNVTHAIRALYQFTHN